MLRRASNVDLIAALEVAGDGSIGPNDPPSSAVGTETAPADEDAGFEDFYLAATDDEWPGQWGAARLGIP